MVNPPPQQVALAQKYGHQYGVDPRLLLAIGFHETQFGTTGLGRSGYTLGYGATDSGPIPRFAGVENQYSNAARTLSQRGVHTLGDVLAGKAAWWATDPAWEHGVASAYRSLGGAPTPAPFGGSGGAGGSSGVASPPSPPSPLAGRQAAFKALQSMLFPDMPALSLPGLQPPPAAPPGMPLGAPQMAPNVTGASGLVHFSPGANRAGVPTNPAVTAFVAHIAQLAGHPLAIGTGSNHNEYVAGTHNISDHWYGEAADVPASGAQLTHLGQLALIAAGMNPNLARQQTGGVFNVNGYNILFNTHVGGDHFTHLHVGLGRRLGRHF